QAAVSMNDLFFSERVTRHEDAADLVGLALADLKRHSYAVVGLGPIDTRLHSYVRITFRIVQLHQCSAGLVHRDRRINIVFLQHAAEHTPPEQRSISNFDSFSNFFGTDLLVSKNANGFDMV